MEKEEIKFKHWKTGHEITRKLSSSNPGENFSGLICPFDDTEIIRWYDQASFKGYTCPNCGLEYSLQFGDQESVDEFAKEYFQRLEKRLVDLSNEQIFLSKKLSIAKSKGLYGKVNKK